MKKIINKNIYKILIDINNIYNLNEEQIIKIYHILYYSILITNFEINIANVILLCKYLNII